MRMRFQLLLGFLLPGSTVKHSISTGHLAASYAWRLGRKGHRRLQSAYCTFLRIV